MLKRIQRKIKRTFESQCIVLCYHRVGNDVNDKWGNSVSVDNFYDQMKVLQEYYHLISIDQLVQSKQNGKLPEKKCALVTFDDGYEINCHYALDILNELGIPAVFYINTYKIDSDNYYWWDAFQNIFYFNNKLFESLTINIDNQLVNLFFDNPNNKEHNALLIHQLLKGLHPKNRSSLIKQFESNMKKRSNLGKDYTPITSKGLINISANPLFEIGGHSHSHCSLGLIPKKVAREEIISNKEILEKIIGKKIKHFSFPFGGPIDYDSEIIDFVKNAGYESSVTTTRKPFRDSSNIFEIPRFSIKNWTGSIFINKLHNYWSY